MSSILTPFEGVWDASTAAHLLRRATLGPTRKEILEAASRGLANSVNRLLAPARIPLPPVLHIAEDDPDVAFGDTWVNTPYTAGGKHRGASLNAWFFNHLIENPSGLQAKMTLFWLNYFGMAGVSDHRAMYRYIRLFQELATGNFREMIERITVHPAMLEFLDGATNDRKNPNENYARELLELFTIQKGPQVGEGDYTNYTETDVVAIARALTGWKNNKYAYNDVDVPIESYFSPDAHDQGTKTLSHRFNSWAIQNEGDQEYKAVISVILNQPETPRAFCRELYRYFVFHEIGETVEQEVIAPLAATLVSNEFDISPVLEELFNSQHFYDMAVRGPMIKNPYEFLASIARSLGWYGHLKDIGLYHKYMIGDKYERISREIGMHFLSPPTVAGWKAYYDAPRYYRNWASPALLQKRFSLASEVLGQYHHVDNYRIPFDWMSFVKEATEPLVIDAFLDEVLLVFLPRPLYSEQKLALKEFLLQGLPDEEWTLQCANYLANPNDNTITIAFETRLRRLMVAIIGMAEFQLQ
ncbi:MAG: DUF1800 domain-containing protein [Bacteroidota bacterium]